MIRVFLPTHLRTLARVGREVQVDVEGQVTLSAVLDALEAEYPMLRGTMRDQITHKRRDFVRFFACQVSPPSAEAYTWPPVVPK